MKKKSAIFALLLAGVMSFGVVGTAACNKRDGGHKHTWSEYKSDGAEGHHRTTTCEGHDPIDEKISAHDKGDVCGKCGYDSTPGTVHVSSVTISGDNSVKVGGKITLGATVLPENATDKTVTWEITDGATYAEIDQSGVLTAKAAGTVKVKATADGKSSDLFTVTVKPASAEVVHVSGVVLDKTTLTMTVGDAPVKLTATVSPADADDKSYSWSVDKQGVISVENGVVTAVGAGTATVTVTTTDGSKTATCAVTVQPSETPKTTYTVTFMDSGEEVSSETVEDGNKVSAPAVTKAGHYLKGWYENQAGSGSAFDFKAQIKGNKTLYAVWAAVDARLTYNSANFESASFEWGEGDIASATVEYKLSSASEYTQVDSMLIRQLPGGTARVDVVGLKGGEKYDFKITPSSGNEITLSEMAINAYDRSGYAHFNYSDGVGAYNDDGTIKDNILVIYLTEDNKHDVLDYCYVDGVKVDITQYVTDSTGTVHKGIGEILNNRRYSGNDRKNVGIARLSHEYAGVALRIIGEVSNSFLDGTHCEITGLTDYNSTGNGGTSGDSGAMARMVNARNVTIEGIGEDATVKGWGFHYVASAINASKYDTGNGVSFEVRNVTFKNYPEDALGMEGEQGVALNDDGTVKTSGNATTADLVASVERVWVHNNTFKQGGGLISGAESDKQEGDGSCDFKRGQYYTNSYNKYEDCHKTNLIGNGDDALTYNVTFHHNWWYNCAARQPLARRANIHYYNNLIQYQSNGDAAMSMRALSYVFMEGNYFDGCKLPMEEKDESGVGKAKSFNDIVVGTYGSKTNQLTIVTDREAVVENNCRFIKRNIDYRTFDTDPNLFYYDAVNKRSDCLLTDAITARKDVIIYSGVQKRDYSTVDTSMSKYTPTQAVTLTDTMTEIQLPGSKNDAENNGVLFRDMTGACKAKGQLATFKLDVRAQIEVTGTGGDLIMADGTPIALEFTTFAGTLEAGTYFIRSSKYTAEDASNTKEVSISKLAFKLGVSDEEVAANVISLIDAIPATVTESDGAAITAARAAYDALSAAQKALVTNLSTLTEAETAFANIAVTSINTKIAALAETTTATTEEEMRTLLAQYNEVKTLYEAIPADKISQVSGYEKVTNGIAALTVSLKPYDVKKQIEELPAKAAVTSADKAAVTAARTAYDALTDAEKTIVGDITKLTDAEAKLAEIAAQTVVYLFEGSIPDGVTLTGGNTGFKDKSTTYEYNGQTHSQPFKLQSNNVLKFSVEVKSTVNIYLHTGKNNSIKLDGTEKSPTDGLITVTLEAGEHTIERVSEVWICYIEVTGA